MNAVIYYSVIYILEAYIIWHYCSNMFLFRFNRLITSLMIIPLYTITLLTIPYQNILLNMLAFCTVHFLYILLFKVKWYSAIFHAAITTSIMSLSELVVGTIVPSALYDFYSETTQTQLLTLAALLSKLLYFIILQTIIHYFGKSKEPLVNVNKGISLLIVVPSITLWIISTFSILSLTAELNQFTKYMISISALLLLVINFLVFSIYRYNQRKEAVFLEMQLQLQKESDTTEYYRMLIREHENQSILIHDTKKHLQSLAALNEQGAQSQIAEYINSLLHSSALKGSVRVCDHDLLNAIIGRYAQLFEGKKISFRADIRSKCLYFMQNDDITSVFCNLLDNAWEATQSYPEAFIDLYIGHKVPTDFTLVTMINSCRDNPFDKSGKLITRRPDRPFRGYGMKSVERIVKKYKGEMTCYYDEETCTFHTILLLKDVAQKLDRI